MKKKWSREWKGSGLPRKQRKYRANAPGHARRKMVASHLSPSLRKLQGFRSLPVRKGDEVRVMRGEFKGKTAKISRVDTGELRVYLEGVKVKKVSGQEKEVGFDPSNLMITVLNTDDKERLAVIKRRSKASSAAKVAAPAKAAAPAKK